MMPDTDHAVGLSNIAPASALDSRLQAYNPAKKGLADEYANILRKIRRERGFENFLLPRKIAELIPEDRNGPIVIINVHESRCDALAVFSAHQIVHIPLRGLTLDRIHLLSTAVNGSLTGAGARQRGAISSIQENENNNLSLALEILWNLVVHPILEAVEPRVCHTCLLVLFI